MFGEFRPKLGPDVVINNYWRIKLYLELTIKIYLGCHQLIPQVTLYNVETKTMLKNKLGEEKTENPVGKPPLKMNTESSLNHPDELTPNSEWR